MTILKITKFPDKTLSYIATPIKHITKTTTIIIKDMIETMFYYKGIGIAATQVNIQQKIIILNMSEKYTQPLIILNPKIFHFSNKSTINKEGCLSFPGLNINVKRKNLINIKFMDTKKIYHTLQANRLLSICLQHEIDHLNGITLYNKISKFKKKLFFKNLI